ncbi:N-acetylglucosaminyl-diphospho-decaprenol L-rhamnosyltransferase [Conyzicola nivalis]|uniref:N-acetylglucosaminyl-diphospho-decaprenol L-rhamnosyltransferase n=1 Tax=Conyzicola nivalis TaxID=1477021 RepID=A0ABV2QRE3_9MICO
MSAASSADAARTAIVTVSYGSFDVLVGFLDSVAAASSQPTTVVVADNVPSGDAVVAELAREHAVTYLPLNANLGYGGAINAAVATLPSSVEWILVSNPDVSLTRGALDTLVAVGDSDPRIGSVGPEVLTAEGDVYPSARSVPSLRTGVGHALFVNLWAGNPWTRSYRNDTDTRVERRDAGWLSGSCVLVRRSAFTELGGFDSGFFMYFEDVDLGYRLGKLGYRNVYEPSAQVVHTGAHSTTSDSARMIQAHHDSARRFLNKKYSGWWLWPIRVSLTVGLKVRSALVRRSFR